MLLRQDTKSRVRRELACTAMFTVFLLEEVNRVFNSRDVDNHYANQNPSYQDTRRSAGGECRPRPDEQPCANRTCNGYHLKMPWAHLLLQHRRVVSTLLHIVEILSAGDYDTAARAVVSVFWLIDRKQRANLVVPGARLKLSKDRPSLVQTLSFRGS